MALALAEAGADIAGLDRGLSSATGEQVRALGRHYHELICDLRTAGPNDINRIVAQTATKSGIAGITRALTNE